MPHLPSLTSLAKSAGCAAKIAQADLAKALTYLPISKDSNLLVNHTGSDDAAVYFLQLLMIHLSMVRLLPQML